MQHTLSKPYIKYSLLALYIVIMSCTTGIGLLWGLPMLGFVAGAFLSYTFGLLLSCVIVYLIFFRWEASSRTKLLVAAVLLVLLAAAGLLVAYQGIVEGNKRVIELLGK